MIQTFTVPTARLSQSSRLLLMIGDSPCAFTEAQLVFAVKQTTEAMQSLIASHGRPRQDRRSTDRVLYLAPINGDPAEDKAFEDAFDWLAYRSLAVRQDYEERPGEFERAVLLIAR